MGANHLIISGNSFPPLSRTTQLSRPQPADFRMTMAPDLLACAILATLLACQRPANRSSSEPHLELSWSGKERGKLSGAATAEWCEARRFLEIRTVQGDTGAALALYPERALAAGRYPVVDPPKAESLPPAAGIAVRWLGQTVVQGFQGDSGSVILERSSTGLLVWPVRGTGPVGGGYPANPSRTAVFGTWW